MLSFMDYLIREFGYATDWNIHNSYSFLTASSDALLNFETPTSTVLHVSSLSTANFATSYTLSALGQLEGSLSYLYSNTNLGHIDSKASSLPLRRVVEGYRDVPLPVKLAEVVNAVQLEEGRKPTLLHATLALPPPSTLTALYARRVRYDTQLSFYLNSRSQARPTISSQPSASLLVHAQHDTGRYSIEGLASTDSALFGARGLWNFGIGKPESEFDHENISYSDALSEVEGNVCVPLDSESLESLSPYIVKLKQKPSLLSAGAEFYYSPFSHVIGLSTGLRFTTLPPLSTELENISKQDERTAIKRPLAGTSAALSSSLFAPASVTSSSFPYTMTLTLNPIIGSLASTYSVKPSSNLSLSTQFDFNMYSWESRYVLGAEIWRKQKINGQPLNLGFEEKADDSTDLPSQTHQRDAIDENVIKLRLDDGFNVRALWTGRLKGILISAGVSISPVDEISAGMLSSTSSTSGGAALDEEGRRKRWTGKLGISLSYST